MAKQAIQKRQHEEEFFWKRQAAFVMNLVEREIAFDFSLPIWERELLIAVYHACRAGADPQRLRHILQGGIDAIDATPSKDDGPPGP